MTERRERGEGSIYRPKYKDAASGQTRESAIFWISYYRNATKIRESSKSDRRADAAKLLKQRLVDVAQGKRTGPEINRTTFEDLARGVEDDYVVNGRRSVKRLRESLAQRLGLGLPITKLSAEAPPEAKRARCTRGAAGNRSASAAKAGAP
jgi:hypothetical protein